MGKPKMTRYKNSFHKAVEATPDVKNCYQAGLLALGIHSSKISVATPSFIEGSVDLDGSSAFVDRGVDLAASQKRTLDRRPRVRLK